MERPRLLNLAMAATLLVPAGCSSTASPLRREGASRQPNATVPSCRPEGAPDRREQVTATMTIPIEKSDLPTLLDGDRFDPKEGKIWENVRVHIEDFKKEHFAPGVTNPTLDADVAYSNTKLQAQAQDEANKLTETGIKVLGLDKASDAQDTYKQDPTQERTRPAARLGFKMVGPSKNAAPQQPPCQV